MRFGARVIVRPAGAPAAAAILDARKREAAVVRIVAGPGIRHIEAVRVGASTSPELSPALCERVARGGQQNGCHSERSEESAGSNCRSLADARDDSNA